MFSWGFFCNFILIHIRVKDVTTSQHSLRDKQYLWAYKTILIDVLL